MESLLGTVTKQPGETRDYYVDFTDWLSSRADSPASHNVTVDPGVTLVASALSSGRVKVVLSGGTSGSRYKVTVQLTTDASPAIVREVDFLVRVRDV